MNALDRKGPLELEVSNFGPIVEAKVALRPMTLFVGPSNTGKSCMAVLIYALHRLFSRDVGPTYPYGVLRWHAPVLSGLQHEARTISEKESKELRDWANQLLRVLE